MAIVDALASGEELTATECAALTGLSPSATAYHLKFLESHGFAEPAPARSDGRQRPWRASPRGIAVELDTTTPAGAAAAAAVGIAYFDQSRAIADEFLAGAHEEPLDWQDAAFFGNADVWLTAAEARATVAALVAVLEPFRDRTLGERPDGARRVRVMNIVLPHKRP